MEEIKPGDNLIARSLYHGYRVVGVLRVTKTQIVVFDYSETKLRNPFKNGCWAIGARGYNHTSYYLPTPELMERIENQNLLSKVSKLDFSKLTNDKLKQIIDIAS